MDLDAIKARLAAFIFNRRQERPVLTYTRNDDGTITVGVPGTDTAVRCCSVSSEALVDRIQSIDIPTELERLQRIEAAARTYLDETTHFGAGAVTAARKALIEALES